MESRSIDIYIKPPSEPVNLVYRISWLISRVLFSTWIRCGRVGIENFPKEGPCLILCTHASHLDPPLIGQMVWREMHSMGRDELFRIPLVGWWISKLNSHPIRRGAIDRHAIKVAQAILAAGFPLLIFPEGTRSERGTRGKPLGGFGMILEKDPDTPCVPVVIDGIDNALGRGMLIPRPVSARLLIGAPFQIESRGEDESRRSYYQRCANSVEEQWASLLPS